MIGSLQDALKNAGLANLGLLQKQEARVATQQTQAVRRQINNMPDSLDSLEVASNKSEFLDMAKNLLEEALRQGQFKQTIKEVVKLVHKQFPEDPQMIWRFVCLRRRIEEVNDVDKYTLIHHLLRRNNPTDQI